MNNFYRIITIRFHGKRIDWKAVEESMSHYKGKEYIVENYGDTIKIGSRFPDEYCGSLYTKKLRGALLKAKANASTIIPDLIARASNRRWIENKDEKHAKDACKGWYRYDTFFSLPVYNDGGEAVRENVYRATIVARINDEGIYLHDIVNIKKEASKPFES